MWRRTFPDLWKFCVWLRGLKRKLFWKPKCDRGQSHSCFRWERGDSAHPSCIAEVAGFTRVPGDAVGTTEMDSRQPDKEMHRRHLVTLTNAVLQGWGNALWRALQNGMMWRGGSRLVEVTEGGRSHHICFCSNTEYICCHNTTLTNMTRPVLIRPYHPQLGNPVQSILNHVFYLTKAFVEMKENILTFSSNTESGL